MRGPSGLQQGCASAVVRWWRSDVWDRRLCDIEAHRGYFLKLAKSWFVCTEADVPSAQETFCRAKSTYSSHKNIGVSVVLSALTKHGRSDYIRRWTNRLRRFGCWDRLRYTIRRRRTMSLATHCKASDSTYRGSFWALGALSARKRRPVNITSSLKSFEWSQSWMTSEHWRALASSKLVWMFPIPPWRRNLPCYVDRDEQGADGVNVGGDKSE